MTRYRRLSHSAGLLLSTLLLSSKALAQPNPNPGSFTQQAYLVGDITPFEYSISDFLEKTSTTDAKNSFAVPGYDITATRPSGQTTGNGGDSQDERDDEEDDDDTKLAANDFAIDGWRLTVGATRDIPIPNDVKDKVGIGATPFFDAAIISLSPPARLTEKLEKGEVKENWSLCSAIWPLGLSKQALEGKQSGSGSSCSSLLSAECIAEMEAGFNSAGFCQNQTLPQSCAPFLVGGGRDEPLRPFNLPQSTFPFCSDEISTNLCYHELC